MLLVADGGSSKTDWILLHPDLGPEKIHTGGLNPLFFTEKEIVKSLQSNTSFENIKDKVSELYFFGAGCNSPDKREIVSNALSHIFPNAFINVESDVLGSALAACKDQPGFCSIMGTESNISFYDGEQVTPSNLGLGYILGEEGSGTYFGKALLTDFFYKKMPLEIHEAFDKEFKISKELVIKSLYQKSFPNFFLGSFAPFMSKFLNHDYVKDLLNKGFEDFINSHILIYPNFKDYNFNFVGSIAYYYQDILTANCKKHEINVGTILEKPIDQLFLWIKNREGF